MNMIQMKMIRSWLIIYCGSIAGPLISDLTSPAGPQLSDLTTMGKQHGQMTPWAKQYDFYYGGLSHPNNKFQKCAWCQFRHKSPRWWGRDKERDGRCTLPPYLWCNVCKVHLHRKIKEPKKYPRHPGWLQLEGHIEDRDNTGALIRAGHHRPDLQALRVFWVPYYYFYFTMYVLRTYYY